MNRFRVVLIFTLFMVAAAPLAAIAADSGVITATNMPACMTPGEAKSVSVSVFNNGDTEWNAVDPNAVRLSYHWEGPLSVWDGIRTDLTGNVARGASLVLNAQLKASDTATAANLPVGTYTLKWQMIRKGVGWFPTEKAYTVEVKSSCAEPCVGPMCGRDRLIDVARLSDSGIQVICRRIDCGAILATPVINNVAGLVSPMGILHITGAKFGSTSNKVKLVAGGFSGGFLDLSVLAWSSTEIMAQMPDVGNVLDFPAKVRVERAGGGSAEKDVNFVAGRDYYRLRGTELHSCGNPDLSWDDCFKWDDTISGNHVPLFPGNFSGDDVYFYDMKPGFEVDRIYFNDMTGGRTRSINYSSGSHVSVTIMWSANASISWSGLRINRANYHADIHVKGPKGFKSEDLGK